MMLRLVLVSLVAGLGIGVPSWPILEDWVASTQKWMNARLAAMDARQSDEKNYVVIHDLLKVEMEHARMARIQKRAAKFQALAVASRPKVMQPVTLVRSNSTAHNTFASFPLPIANGGLAPDRRFATQIINMKRVEPVKPAPPTFEPMVVGDRLMVGTAYELNFRNEGIGLLPRGETRSVAPPAARPADLLTLVASRYGTRGLSTLRGLGQALRTVAARELGARELAARELAARELAARESAARELAAREFEAMEQSANLYFADAPVAPAVEIETVASVEPVAEVASFDAMENSENLYFAGSLAADLQEPLASAVVATATTNPLPEDAFAPVEPTVVASRRMQLVGPPRPEVNRAVRLTRDALYAWMNVLTGPALVTVGPSSSTNR